jgi:hypothetical protein
LPRGAAAICDAPSAAHNQSCVSGPQSVGDIHDLVLWSLGVNAAPPMWYLEEWVRRTVQVGGWGP